MESSQSHQLGNSYPEPPLPFGRIRIDPLHPDYHTQHSTSILDPAPPYTLPEELAPSLKHEAGLIPPHDAHRLEAAAHEAAESAGKAVHTPSRVIPQAPIDISDCFRDDDREEFRRILHNPKHVNAMRIDSAKQRRIMHYLCSPTAPAQRGQSAKEKFEARKKWMLRDDDSKSIYRQPSAKFPTIRKLVVEEDAFDVIAQEHLRLSHWGRNRLQKHISEQFYGVSREEIQWVIDRCMQCGPKRRKQPAVKHASVEAEPPDDAIDPATQTAPEQEFTPAA